mgnify:CR=1 FL=1
MARILIAGCGYLGAALGRRLFGASHEVWGLRRGPSGTGVPESGPSGARVPEANSSESDFSEVDIPQNIAPFSAYLA